VVGATRAAIAELDASVQMTRITIPATATWQFDCNAANAQIAAAASAAVALSPVCAAGRNRPA